MNMILIITHKEDYTADFIVEKLNSRAIKYYRFNCEDINVGDYYIQIGRNEIFSINKNNSFSSIWFRRTKLPEIQKLSYGEKLFLLNEYDALLSNMYQIVKPKKWLSYPPSVYQAENKLYQLKTAVKLGFNIPDTIVTNDREALKKFAETYDYKLIIKPLSNGRIVDPSEFKTIYTNRINKNHIDTIDNFSLTPSIIQPYIEKEYEIRATVVGNKLFAAKVDSQVNEKTKIDWRREKLQFTSYNLPQEVSKKCVALVKQMNLAFGAIDLIRTPSGEYVFLEINPNGQWVWIEIDTGLQISDAIINFLN